MRSTIAPQTLRCADSSFHLEGPSAVHVNTMALHTSSSTWGPDALAFNPARWLLTDGIQATISTPPRGTFLPWSISPLACPGQKMSQVEFVAIIATLFGQCSARPIGRASESAQQASQRLLDLLQDSQPILTLQINRPEDVAIQWVGREPNSG
jgi:hypothetical protein